MRGGLAAVLVVGVLAACGGGGADGTAEPSAEARRTKTEPAPDRTKVNKAEIAWAGSVIEWAIEFGGPIEAAASVREEVARTKRIPKRVAGELTYTFETILNCASSYRSAVGEPPSDRLATAGQLLEGACQKFAVGADAALEVIDGEQANSRAILLDQWKVTWREARDLLTDAGMQLVDFQPANAHELAVAEGATLETRVEPHFGEVASLVVGTEVEARCWSPVDWSKLLQEMKTFTGGRIGPGVMGFTGFGDQRMNLAPEVCGGLVALAYEGQRPARGFDRLKIALGVGILMHEAQHANGVVNEAVAECFGMQAIPPAAERLGADQDYAQSLAEAYWNELYPELPRAYSSDECRDGGRLDQLPDSSVWP